MSTTAHHPYDEPESSSVKLFGNFLLLSLLAHAVILTLLLLWAVFHPEKKLEAEKPNPTVSLSLVQPPKTIFIPTQPQQNTPHKVQQVESANDTVLQSKSQVARDKSIMPDVEGKPKGTSLNDAPKVESPKPEVSSTPPTPKATKPEKPQPPQPPTPPTPQPQAKPTPPKPPVPAKPQPQVDPDTGLPLLPAINAQTMAQANPQTASQPLTPQPIQQQVATSVHGAIGRPGDNSPAAMATDLGKYKQRVYAAVGSRWYPDIDQHFGIIPVGVVRIRYTIHSDGTLTDVVITEGDNANLDQLKFISKHALISSAPFDRFSDAMIKQVGDSYTDEFSFSVY